MSNAFLNREAIETFLKTRSLLNVFSTAVQGIDPDVVATGDKLVWTVLDTTQVGKGVAVDGRVTTYGRPARVPVELTLDFNHVIAYYINKDDSEVSKSSLEQLRAETEAKADALEAQVLAAIVDAATDPIGSVLDCSTDSAVMRSFSALETQLVKADVPRAERVAVTAPEVVAALNLSKVMNKLDAFVEIDNYAGHVGSLAVYSDNGIVADEDGTFPVIYGAKSAFRTAVLIDNLTAKDGASAVGFTKAATIVEGEFVAGFKAVREELYLTPASLEAIAG